MKGWLQTRTNPLSLRPESYFFRLQWGFLSRHLTDSSAAQAKYFIHDSEITSSNNALKIHLQFGPLGIVYATETTPHQLPSQHRLTLHASSPTALNLWLSCLHRATNRKFDQWYRLGPELGHGSDARVFCSKCRHPSHAPPVAVKRISLQPTSPDDPTSETTGFKLHRIFREIQLQHKAASHSSYIADIYDVFFDADFCHIVMQYGNKGSLSQLLNARQGNLPEILVRNLVTQIAMALLSLHQSNIVHRDVKCDNVILRQPNASTLSVMLSDFGFATVWRPDMTSSMDDFCHDLAGTELYLAPEVARGDWYGAPVDVFSLGVVCHVCLTGLFPFDVKEGSETSAEREARYEGLDELEMCEGISEEAVSFCKMLLNREWRKRPTIAGVLQHRWLRKEEDDRVAQRRKIGAGKEMVNGMVVFRRGIYAVMAVAKLKQFGMAGSLEREVTVYYPSTSSEGRSAEARGLRAGCFGG